MATNTDIGTIEANANMKGGFGLNFKRVVTPATVATAYDLTGCAITAEIRATAQPGTPLITPTVSFATPTNGEVSITWTELQAAAMAAPGVEPEMRSRYFIEVDIAYASAPTEFVDKYTGWIVLSPGGNS